MEYIIVKPEIKDSATLARKESANRELPVLVNGERNGFANVVIGVSSGYCEVTLDTSTLDGVEAKKTVVDVQGTIPAAPMEVFVSVSG